MNTANRLCLECGKPLKGRRDKKYCDDNCRNNYNNKLHSDALAPVRRINHLLQKNRAILKELLGSEKHVTVPVKTLHEKGFDFVYHTHRYITKEGATYCYCYDYGFLPLEKNLYLVVRKK